MAIRMGQLYDALLAAHVPEDQARQAAEEVADYNQRINAIERDLSVLKSMVATMIALQLLTLGGLFGLLWRVIPLAR
jgi:hypothetical protein